MQYPALQTDASVSSDLAQRLFLCLVSTEFCLLFTISTGYLFLPSVAATHIALMVLVGCALAIAILRNTRKPDEDWYQFRALAESVKTLTWRFATKAEPFHKSDELARSEFRNSLRELLKVNSSLGPKFESYNPDKDQITAEMLDLRGKPLSDRMKVYRALRLDDQRVWYATKSSKNQKAARNWYIGLTCLYILLFILLGFRIYAPDAWWASPDPILIAASSIVGWIQVKKFNDLAAAYLLTAHEISIAVSEIEDISTEDRWARFVSSCEQVFSREHTQWVVRRRE
jgi:SMODS and SLOG-associating 2TM effector domain 3/SMODS and SLOG-associating 2TM effector domain 1